MALTLHGWSFSPYLRAVRIALEEKRAEYALREMTPTDLASDAGRRLSPFGHVPILEHDGFRLIETPAILRYVDAALPGPALLPEDAAGRAHADMLVLTASHYFYANGVMGAFFHDAYRRANGGAPHFAASEAGATAVAPAIAYFAEALRGPWMLGEHFSLADAALAPMLGNFAMSAAGRARLDAAPVLSNWLARAASRASVRATEAPIPRFGLPD